MGKDKNPGVVHHPARLSYSETEMDFLRKNRDRVAAQAALTAENDIELTQSLTRLVRLVWLGEGRKIESTQEYRKEALRLIKAARNNK